MNAGFFVIMMPENSSILERSSGNKSSNIVAILVSSISLPDCWVIFVVFVAIAAIG